MLSEDVHPGRLTETIEERRRTGDIGEEDRPEGALHLREIGRLPHRAEEPEDLVLGHRDDLVGDEAVRLSVDGLHLGRARGVGKAEGRPVVGIEPVREEPDAMAGRQGEVLDVGVGDLGRSQSAKVVPVDVEGQVSRLCRGIGRGRLAEAGPMVEVSVGSGGSVSRRTESAGLVRPVVDDGHLDTDT